MRCFSALMACDIRSSLPQRHALRRDLSSRALGALLQHTPGVQRTADGPGLRGRAAGMMRRISVEDLSNGAHRLVLQRVPYRLQQSLRCRSVAADATGSEAEGSQQPGPDRPLMIAAIALPNAAAVARPVSGVAGRQRAQSIRGEKVMPADPNNSRLLFQRERTVGQADRKNLIWPYAGIVAIGPINDVV